MAVYRSTNYTAPHTHLKTDLNLGRFVTLAQGVLVCVTLSTPKG